MATNPINEFTKAMNDANQRLSRGRGENAQAEARIFIEQAAEWRRMASHNLAMKRHETELERNNMIRALIDAHVKPQIIEDLVQTLRITNTGDTA